MKNYKDFTEYKLSYFDSTSLGICCFKLINPIKISSSKDSKLKNLNNKLLISEYNNALLNEFGINLKKKINNEKIDILFKDKKLIKDFFKSLINYDFQLLDYQLEITINKVLKYFKVICNPFIDNGKLFYLWLTFMNCTETIKEKEIYKTMACNSVTGLSIVQEGITVFANNAVINLLGYSREEILNMSTNELIRIIHADDRDKAISIMKRRIAGEKLDPVQEFRIIRKDGKIRWLSSYSTFIKYNNKPADLISYIDITDKKEALNVVKESETQYKALFNNANDAIFVVEINNKVVGKFIEINENGCELFNMKKEKLLNLVPSDIDTDFKYIKERVLNELFEEGNSIFEVNIETKKNEKKILEISAHLLELKGMDAIMCIARDVTERKKSEIELKNYKNNLEKLVQRRTYQLEKANNELINSMEELKKAQMKLVHAEKMASLGQLTAGIAHEINNPINFIYASIKAIKRNFETIGPYFAECNKNMDNLIGVEINKLKKTKTISFEELREETAILINNILIGAARTADIVKSLRIFSKQDETEKKSINLIECIESALIVLHNRYKGIIQVEKEYQKVDKIKCYPGRMNQVIMNIIDNAIDVITENPDLNEKKIIIKVFKKKKKNKHFLVLRFMNTGPVIPEEVKNKIFEPFFTTKKIGKGTGLGLAISYKIIKDHDGFIEVESSMEKGTIFDLYLPYEHDCQ